MDYEVTYYHDDPDNAATDSRTIGPFRSFEAAVAAAKKPPSPRWNGGASIERGTYDPGVPGVSPESFVRDETTPWYVYDGVVQR